MRVDGALLSFCRPFDTKENTHTHTRSNTMKDLASLFGLCVRDSGKNDQYFYLSGRIYQPVEDSQKAIDEGLLTKSAAVKFVKNKKNYEGVPILFDHDIRKRIGEIDSLLFENGWLCAGGRIEKKKLPVSEEKLKSMAFSVGYVIFTDPVTKKYQGTGLQEVSITDNPRIRNARYSVYSNSLNPHLRDTESGRFYLDDDVYFFSTRFVFSSSLLLLLSWLYS